MKKLYSMYMMYDFFPSGPMFSMGAGWIALLLWSLFWKGLALWHSARRREPWWFIALLIINTAGILEIVYLFLIAKVKQGDLFKNQ